MTESDSPGKQSGDRLCEAVMVKKDEPTPRFWHHAFLHGGQIYVRGGITPHFVSEQDQLASTVEQFNPMKEVWQLIDTEGTPHPGLSQAACVCVDDVLYMYGSDRKVLSQLEMKPFQWSQLWATSDLDDGSTPMIKDACGIVHFADRHLALFGGYACRSGPLQPGSEFILNTNGDGNKGWTNEFHAFNIKKKFWLSPTINGKRPPPTCDFTLSSITDLRAILFGGYQDNGFQDELYIIDFDAIKMEITFTKIEKKRPWPEGRESHAACCLGLNTKHPQLLISGGKNMYDHALKFDLWMLDIAALVWKKVRLPGGQRLSRWGHSLTAVFICPGLEAAVVFGGSPEDFSLKWNSLEFQRLAETTILYFGNLVSEWVLLEERIKTDESPFFFNRTSSSSELTPYELDSQFSMRQIFAMEKAYGVPLLSELAGKNQGFQQQIQVRQPDAPSAITRWLSAAGDANKIKPTWRNLSMVLHKIGLSPLALQMEDCLIEWAMDTTSKLEGDLTSRYGKVMGNSKEEDLHRRIKAFASYSEATIATLKRKYDELRIDLEQLKWQLSTTAVQSKPERESTFTIKAEPKEESATRTVIAGPIPSTSQGQVQQSGEEGYWKQRFQALSDGSDSTIQLLKKENQRLRIKLEELEHQSYTQMDHANTVAFIKAEPPEEVMLASEIPLSSTSLSAARQVTSDIEQGIEKQEEESWKQKYQLLASHSTSTIQTLEVQSEELGEDESLRCQLDAHRISTEQYINGNVNGSTSMITDVALPQSNVGDFELCGVDVCGETTFEITNSARLFEWTDFGLKLHICEGTLPEGVNQCVVSVKASLAGQYQFPENIHLVSAIFGLRCEPMCKFAKTVTMEMEHCAKSADASKLSFVRALCTQETLPYVFKKIGGHFAGGDRIGCIQLNGFSGVGIGQEGSDQREYGASIFYFIQQRSISYCLVKIDFVVTWNTKAHLTAVKKEYKGKEAQLDSELVVEFESDRITIDVPLEGTDVEGGWKILPLAPPVVLKRFVDSFKQGKMIPKCQFSAQISLHEGKHIPSLQHRVQLIGARSPYNTLMLAINPPMLTSDAPKKRSLSESDAVPEPKRRREHIIQKSHSLDSNLSVIEEGIISDGTQNRNRPAPEPSSSSTYCLSGVDSSDSVILGEDDLQDVMGEVMSKKASFYALGRGLGISASELDVVRTQQNHNFDSALNDVLLLWLRQGYNTKKFGRPTWRMLVKAVEGINDHALAEKLAQRHTAHS